MTRRRNDYTLGRIVKWLRDGGADVRQLRTFRDGADHWTLRHRTVDDCAGISSRCGDGHMAMWDIDGEPDVDRVIEALAEARDRHALPPIELYSSGTEGHWLAYSPCRRPFDEVLRIALLTELPVDLDWLITSKERGDAVIRMSPKGGRDVQHVAQVPSPHPPEIDVRRLTIVTYEARL